MRLLLAVSLIALTVLPACGGGSDRLSAEELRRQADATCVEYERKLDAIETPDSLEGLAAYSRQAGEALAAGLDDLRELEPPEELEERYRRWLATGDDALRSIEELGDAAEQGDEAAVEKLFASAGAEDDESDRLASEIGLKACADD